MSDLENKIDEINKAKRKEHRQERRKEKGRKTKAKFTNAVKKVKDYIESKKAEEKKYLDEVEKEMRFLKKAKETYERFLQLADELKDEDYLTKSGNSQEIDGEVVIAKGDVAPIVCTTYNHEKSGYDSKYGYLIRDVPYEGFIDTKISGVSQKVYVNIRNARWDGYSNYRIDCYETNSYEGFVRMPNGDFEEIDITSEIGWEPYFRANYINLVELYARIEGVYNKLNPSLDKDLPNP